MTGNQAFAVVRSKMFAPHSNGAMCVTCAAPATLMGGPCDEVTGSGVSNPQFWQYYCEEHAARAALEYAKQIGTY